MIVPPAGYGGAPPPAAATPGPATRPASSDLPLPPAGPPVGRLPAGCGQLGPPATRACVSRRRFRIKLRPPSGERIVRASVKVAGRTAKTLTGSKVTAFVNLTGIAEGPLRGRGPRHHRVGPHPARDTLLPHVRGETPPARLTRARKEIACGAGSRTRSVTPSEEGSCDVG